MAIRLAIKSTSLCIGLLLAGSSHAATVNFIYIEAGEGNSSGGHFAVQFADEVYHYQYEHGFIRLFKNQSDAFRVDYQSRQNRGIHIADVEVSKPSFAALHSHFKLKLFAQKQQLRHLQGLQQDQALLRALLQYVEGKSSSSMPSSENSLQLKGAGFFYGKIDHGNHQKPQECATAISSATVMAEVKKKFSDVYGEQFLAKKISILSDELNHLSPLSPSGEAASYYYSFSEHYLDLLTGLLALKALQHNRALAEDACFQIRLPQLTLNASEISQAASYQQQLYLSAKNLVLSNRPDWGYALLVTLARIIALEQSIKDRYWTFLADDDNGAVLTQEDIDLYAEKLMQQRQQDLTNLFAIAKAFKTNSDEIEPIYVDLEQKANRYKTWLESDKSAGLRYQDEFLTPQRNAPAEHFLMTTLPAELIQNALNQQARAETRLTRDDISHNSYHLLTNNCVSSLLQLINEAVGDNSTQMLGGFIDPETHIVPFQAFAEVQRTYRAVKTAYLPAYRVKRLTKLYDQDNDSLVYLRESNVFSSSLYHYNPDDAWFVFFTDDALLARPLFGTINLVAATSQSLFGLLNLPFDRGEEIKTGLRGILATLPELAFFNIRKGSYPFALEN